MKDTPRLVLLLMSQVILVCANQQQSKFKALRFRRNLISAQNQAGKVYIFGTKGSATCPERSEFVPTDTECHDVALPALQLQFPDLNLKKGFSGSCSGCRPKGCFAYSSGNVNFNSGNTGAYADTTPICIRQCPQRFAGTNCTACLPAYTGVNCTDCAPGHYRGASSVCTACPAAHFQPAPNQTECAFCLSQHVGASLENATHCECLPAYAGENCAEMSGVPMLLSELEWTSKNGNCLATIIQTYSSLEDAKIACMARLSCLGVYGKGPDGIAAQGISGDDFQTRGCSVEHQGLGYCLTDGSLCNTAHGGTVYMKPTVQATTPLLMNITAVNITNCSEVLVDGVPTATHATLPTSLQPIYPHSKTFTCLLPDGVGANRMVSLKPNIVSISQTSVSANEILTIHGTDFGASWNHVRAFIGGNECSNTWISGTKMLCRVPEGPPGRDLLKVTVEVGWQVSPTNRIFSKSAVTYSPIIVSVKPDPVPPNTVVTLIGKHFGTNHTNLEMTTDGLECRSAQRTNDNMLKCKVGSTLSYGSNWVNVVLDGIALESPPFEFLAPRVLNVRSLEASTSCAVASNDNRSLVACAPIKEDAIRMQMSRADMDRYGKRIARGRVFIGTTRCHNVKVNYADLTITCRMGQTSGGSLQAVTLVLGGQRFPSTVTVSFKRPMVEDVLGCPSRGQGKHRGTSMCPKGGGTHVTVVGKYFGAPGATVAVSVGSEECHIIKHESNTRLVCALPPAKAEAMRFGHPVVVIQLNQLSMQQNLVSYEPRQCDPGAFVDADDGWSCKDCPRYFYQPVKGSAACNACPGGEWSPDGVNLLAVTMRMVRLPSNITSGKSVTGADLPVIEALNRTWGTASDSAAIKCSMEVDITDPRANNSKSFETKDAIMMAGARQAKFDNLDVTATPGSVVPVRVKCRRRGVDLVDLVYVLPVRPCQDGEIYLGHEQRICLQCLDGTFAKSPGEPVKQCHICAEEAPGAICDHADGTSIETMRAKSAFWIATRSSYIFYRCPVEGSCIGGSHTNATTIKSRCALGHTAVLCAQCKHGYSPGLGGRCKKCDVIRNSSEKGWLVWFGTTGLLMLVAVAYLVAIVKAESGSKTWSCLKKHHGKEVSKMDQAIIRVQDQVRTIISFAQIFASFDLSFSSKTDFAGEGRRMVLPSVVLEICRLLDVFTFNFANLVGQIAPCDTSLSFSAKFALWMAALPTLMAVIAVAHQVVVHTQLRHIEDAGARAVLKTTITDTAIVTANMCCFLLWPTIGRTIFQIFTFTTVEGRVYLLFDMTIQPTDAWWPALAGGAALGIVVYIIGVPLFYFVVLYRQRKWLMSAQEHWVQRRYSGLYKQFEPSYWFWELIEMLRKLLLIGGVLVLQINPTVQALFGLLIVIFYIVLLGNTRPYLDGSTDAVAQMGAVTMVLVLLLGSALSWWSGLQPPGPSLSAVEADGRWAAIRFFSELSATILGLCIVLCVGVTGYTVWSAKGNEKSWSSCSGKTTGTKKVHPMERGSTKIEGISSRVADGGPSSHFSGEVLEAKSERVNDALLQRIALLEKALANALDRCGAVLGATTRMQDRQRGAEDDLLVARLQAIARGALLRRVSAEGAELRARLKSKRVSRALDVAQSQRILAADNAEYAARQQQLKEEQQRRHDEHVVRNLEKRWVSVLKTHAKNKAVMFLPRPQLQEALQALFHTIDVDAAHLEAANGLLCVGDIVHVLEHMMGRSKGVKTNHDIAVRMMRAMLEVVDSECGGDGEHINEAQFCAFFMRIAERQEKVRIRRREQGHEAAVHVRRLSMTTRAWQQEVAADEGGGGEEEHPQ